MPRVDVNGETNSVLSTVGSFIANLPEMIGAMTLDPYCLVVIDEFANGRYVQFWIEPEGKVIAGVISNLNIGEAVSFIDHDEMVLRSMDWPEPSPGPSPTGVSGPTTLWP